MWHFVAAGRIGFRRWTWRKYSGSLPTLRSRGEFQGINEVFADAKLYGFESAVDRWEIFDGQGTPGPRRIPGPSHPRRLRKRS